jgi:two-component sensor histidine kinase
MPNHRALWFWRIVWACGFPIALGLFLLYAWLPADGATGDLESLQPEGFRVQWLFEEREGGLRAGDLIVRAGGHTVDEWLAGAPRGPKWRSGGIVSYEVLRDGQPMTLEIQLAPVPFSAVLRRWSVQLWIALACFAIGTFVFWRRPDEHLVRLLMLFCVTLALQYWGDAYNFQYTTIPWRWPFWIQLAYEHVIYGLTLASICHFALIFPTPQPVMHRFPRLVPFLLYSAHPLAVAGAMAFSSGGTRAAMNGATASWAVATVQIGIAVAAGVHTFRTARDPVARAQIRWLLWCASVGCAVLLPTYLVPLLIGRQPLLAHPALMIFIALIPFTLAITIFRYHLFDIEVIINRTLVYGTLTALLAGFYLLLIPVLTLLVQQGLHQENDTLVIFIATLSIVLAFTPLRRRVQVLIDRTFYRTKLDFQEMLPETTEKLATSIVLDQLAALLTKELPERLQIAWAKLAVLDLGGKYFVGTGAGDDQQRLPTDHPLGVFLQSYGRPLMRLQPPSDLPPDVQMWLDEQGIELSIPLVVGAEQVGVYNLGPKLSGTVYGRDEVRLLYLMGQQAAIAVENSRLFQAEREQRQLAQALQEAADLVSSTLDLDQVLDRILEQVERVVSGDAFNIMLVDGDVARVVRRRGYEHLNVGIPLDSLEIRISEYPTLTRMMETGKPVVIPDTAADPGWVSQKGWEWLRSYLSTPIQVAGQTVGFLNVDRAHPSQFGSAEAPRLEGFAHHAATALQNAQLYEQAQREISERIRAEEHIKASLAEKEVLLKEIHHRVKNNLQVISSLLYLQSKHSQDEATLEMFLESQQRVRSMALVHERLYQTENLARVDCAEYVRDLASYLRHSYGMASGPVNLEVDVADVSLAIDTAVPFGLIVNELTSNALKHAFPHGQGGKILIQLTECEDGQCNLVIRDNGTGLPKGFDLRDTKSLGLQLVKTLTKQLGGTIDLDRGSGTAFRITFPNPENGKGG